ncbi:hypothetical protein KR50_23340 [Jeotgalibacillus campisalis]|uniref:Uncharacterized protein n=1 Tax=Jeotgalibacillus campisalis TaxID=220754 RepID=A0A0C2VRG0_9BACL|nr:hypothetical protein KR50_23340 [Jeotgalibacillus campisalis]
MLHPPFHFRSFSNFIRTIIASYGGSLKHGKQPLMGISLI